MPGDRFTEPLVWYVGFGSNLLRERLLAYLAGAPDGTEFGPQAGARDPSPPIADRPTTIAHRLRFGSWSQGWGGAVAFVDAERDAAVPTHARAYLLTRGQLADIAAQENRWLGGVDLPEPGTVAVGAGVDVCEGRYRRLLRLDDIEWRARKLRVPRPKAGAPLVLPLTDGVGAALERMLLDRWGAPLLTKAPELSAKGA